MGRTCALCKNSSRNTKDVCYFSLPSHEETRKKWIDVLPSDYRPSRSTCICSNHFSRQEFYRTSSGKGILMTKSVPSVGIGILVDNLEFVEDSTSVKTAVDSNEKVILLPKDEKFQYMPGFQDCENHLRNFEHFTTLNLDNTPRKIKLKRELSQSTKRLTNAKKRLKKMEYRQRKLRKEKASLMSIIEELKDQHLITEEIASTLETNGTGISDLFRRNIAKNRGKKVPQKYSEKLRTFALTLNFYSPRAYRYVRKTFRNCLPAESTLRKWYQSVPGEPGFSTAALEALERKAGDSRIPVALLMDEVAIKQHEEWANGRLYGHVDFGTGTSSDSSAIAKEALVFLVVGLKHSFKIPVGFFLIDSMGGLERKNVVLHLLELLHEHKVDVECLTFDGAASNVSMAKMLGCSFELQHFKTDFAHPVSKKSVNVFFDACHMLKLVRNTFGDYKYIVDDEGRGIKFSHIEKLHHYQESFGIHYSNKLRRSHMEYFKKKMNVRLAAQMLSNSVATALAFCEKEGYEGFSDVGPTIKFLKVFNGLFDILNSRNLLSKGLKKPLSANNIGKIEDLFSKDFHYIANLRCPKTGKLMIDSQRKTGFLGFLILIESTRNLYRKLADLNMNFLMTYKYSQDHIEIFFSKIRSYGGCNNNPTVRQFCAAYKRLLLHNDLSDVNTGNCVALEDIPILTVSSGIKNQPTSYGKSLVEAINSSDPNKIDIESVSETSTEIDMSFENVNSEDLVSTNLFFLENVVAYVAGYIVSKLKKLLRCTDCRAALAIPDEEIPRFPNLSFIRFKCRGGLCYPTQDVISIYKSAEKRLSQILKSTANVNLVKLVNTVALDFMGDDIFPSLSDHVRDSDPLQNHVWYLLKLITTKYCECRLYHISKLRSSRISSDKKKSRQVSNKLILFNGL